jgi:hypothetical protein
MVPDVGSHWAPAARYVSRQLLHFVEVASPGVLQ